MRSGEEQTEVAAVLMAGYTHLYDNAADFDAVSQELRTRGSDPEPSVLVAVLHQRLVGTVALSCQPLDGNIAVPSGAVSLRRLAVHPRFCRQGIATRLVSGALDLARSMGMQRVVLQTDDDMVAARRLYAKLGFRPASQFDTDLGIGVATLGMHISVSEVRS